MSLHRPSTEIPGKVFLFGEYAVLEGIPACLAAVGPRFGAATAAAAVGAVDDLLAGPENSPIWLLAQFAGAQGLKIENTRWVDPWGGAGGFGASTARFALAYHTFANQAGWSRQVQDLWRLYRELTVQSEGRSPSGADLVAQWQGGISLWDPTRRSVSDVFALLDWQRVLVFAATHQGGRKVATHAHLREIGTGALQGVLPRLESLVIKAGAAIAAGEVRELGDALTSYAEALAEAGLESEAARQDREALVRLPGVLGVKGCGALLSDAVVAIVDTDPEHRAGLVRAAIGRGLKLVADGLTREMGVATCV